MDGYNINHLLELESESIFIIREVASQFEHPTLLFSGGKDSIVMYHLARKAFWPAKVPFPLMHIDTGHNFAETLEFRDNLMDKTNGKCIVRLVQDTIDQGKVVEETGVNASRNVLQTVTLLDAIEELKLLFPKIKEILIVILYGSVARGDFSRRHSDLDLLIVLNQKKTRSRVEDKIKKFDEKNRNEEES